MEKLPESFSTKATNDSTKPSSNLSSMLNVYKAGTNTPSYTKKHNHKINQQATSYQVPY